MATSTENELHELHDVQIGAPSATVILDHHCVGVFADCSSFATVTNDCSADLLYDDAIIDDDEILLPNKAFNFFFLSLPNCELIETDFDDDGKSN